MPMTLIKAGAIACAFGGFAIAGSAHAVTPFPLNGTASLAVPTADQEFEAVEESLRSEIYPPGTKGEEADTEGMTEDHEGHNADGDLGEEEIERDMEKPEKN